MFILLIKPAEKAPSISDRLNEFPCLGNPLGASMAFHKVPPEHHFFSGEHSPHDVLFHRHFVGIGFDRDQTKVARLTLCGIDSRWTQRGDSHLNLLVPFWYRYLQYFNLYLLSMRGPLISLALFSEVEPKASQSELRFMGAPDNQVFRSAPFWMVEDDPHGRRRPT